MSNRLRILTLAALSGAMLAADAPAGAAGDAPATVVSEPTQRTQLELTVYNQNLGLVREVRRVAVPAGAVALEFQGVPSQIQPKTLVLAIGGKTGLSVLEQNYEFDLMSREKIMEKYVGHDVAWQQETGGRITGKLLGMANGPVYAVNGEIVFDMPGRIVLPSLPADLRARPTLVWRAEAKRAGDAEIDASYLTGGLSWAADYILQLTPKGDQASLQAWVSVDNRSGATYDDAKLMLVAGDIHQAARPPIAMKGQVYAMADEARAVTEEALYDYHLYTVNWPTTLKDNQTKQVSLFDADGVTVTKQYTTRAQGQFFRRGGWGEMPQDVTVTYAFENRQDNHLGLPMPAGVVRVYGEAQSGSRQLLGEDRIDHTPKDERVNLEVGKAFDVVATRVQKDFRKVADTVSRSTFAITLRNHKDEAVSVHVQEMVGGDWEVLESSQPFQKLSAQALEFVVDVPKDGEKTVTYTVQVSS